MQRRHGRLVSWALLCALAMPAALVERPASGQTPPPFTDPACPDATPVSRQLSAMLASSSALTPELMQTTQQLATIYAECAAGYDRDAAGAAGAQDQNLLNRRLYAHLALARALLRVGNFDAVAHKYDPARAAYDSALASIAIMNAVTPEQTPPGSSARALLDKSREVLNQIEVAQAALPGHGATPVAAPAGRSPTPSGQEPAPSPTPSGKEPQHS
jgi:hypothetical protein